MPLKNLKKIILLAANIGNAAYWLFMFAIINAGYRFFFEPNRFILTGETAFAATILALDVLWLRSLVRGMKK